MSMSLNFVEEEAANLAKNQCFTQPNSECPDFITECFSREVSQCNGTIYSSRYDNASAAWVVYCAILMFFMKAGFLYVEQSFSKDDKVFRRRVVLAKYIDIFAGTFGFWLFGYAISANTNVRVLGEDQDYIFWFFRFTFASNTATILGGTLVGQGVQLRTTAIFIYSFVMTAFIHPVLARIFWSTSSGDLGGITWSPYAYCNGTFVADRDHTFDINNKELGGFIFIDFAGSGLVHVCGGIGGLVLAIFHKMETSKKMKKVRECGTCCGLLRRDTTESLATNIAVGVDQPESVDRPRSFLEWMYPSGGGDENVESAALGIIILWTTWFAFNAGSTESISGKAVQSSVGRIALVMCLGCASAGIVQTLVSGLVQMYKRDETFNSNEIANVILSALVAVTGCCPFIEPYYALIIGVITVGVYHLGCFIEYLLRLHDGARVFPVHGMCGLWGVLCVGIFSRGCLIRELYDLCFCVNLELPAEIDMPGYLIAYQLAGGLFIAMWSFVTCAILFLALWFFPVRIILTCLPKFFQFDNEKRGKIKFTGNILFTHFNEIGEPNSSAGLDDTREDVNSYKRSSGAPINMTQGDLGYNSPSSTSKM